jgi:hypothetical protein
VDRCDSIQRHVLAYPDLFVARRSTGGLRCHDLRFYWYTWEKGNNLVFFTLLGGALAVFGSFGWFAYADHARIVSERQRQADLTCLERGRFEILNPRQDLDRPGTTGAWPSDHNP